MVDLGYIENGRKFRTLNHGDKALIKRDISVPRPEGRGKWDAEIYLFQGKQWCGMQAPEISEVSPQDLNINKENPKKEYCP